MPETVSETTIHLLAPLVCTKRDLESPEWPALRAALLDNIRSTYDALLQSAEGR